MGYKPTITNISAFDATQGTTVYFGWKGNAAFANELIIKNSETLEVVYQYKTARQMGLYHEMNIAEGATESFVNGRLYQATLIVYDKDDVASDASDPVTFWCFSTPIFEITNDFVNTGIVTMSSLYLNFKYKQDEKEALNEYTVKLYDSNNQLLHQSKTYNTSISNGELVYRIEGLQNTHGYKVRVEGITIHGMEVSTGDVIFSIKYDKMGVGALVNLKDIGDGKISIGSNFKILDAISYPDPPKYIDNEEVDLRKPGSYVEFYDGFVVDGNFECKLAFRAPNEGTLCTLSNKQGDTIKLTYEHYDIYYEDSVIRKYYFRLNVYGENTNINIFSELFDKLTYGQRIVALIQYRNGYYNLKLKISKDTTDAVAITYHVDQDIEYTEMINIGDSIIDPVSFAVEKEGYEFVGWKTDNVASGDVLPDYAVAEEESVLYAVFAKPVTLTCISYNNLETVEGNIYYNNGVEENAKFTLPVGSTYDGWNWKGWSDVDVTDASIDVIYKTGETISLSESASVYGMYGQDVSIKYYNNSKTENTASGTRYYNSYGTLIDPAFILEQEEVEGWNACGWSTGASVNSDVEYKNATEFRVKDSVTLYGVYEKPVTVTYYNNSTTEKTVTNFAFRNYIGDISNASFTLSQSEVPGWTKNGWSTNPEANASTAYNDATTFERLEDITLYGKYKKTVAFSYNGNGNNSGSTASNSGMAYRNHAGDIIGAEIALASNGFSKTNCSFVKWAEGSINGTQYDAGEIPEAITENTIFYAIWKPNSGKKVLASGTGAVSNRTVKFDTTNYNSIKATLTVNDCYCCNFGAPMSGSMKSSPISINLTPNSGVITLEWTIQDRPEYGIYSENISWNVTVETN